MMKNKKLKVIATLSIFIMLSIALVPGTSYGLITQTVKSWYWTNDNNISAIATGDVNGDGRLEVVSGGYYNDGIRWVTQLVVWDGSTLTPLNSLAWYWTYDTQISSVSLANITGSTALDIIVGGSYFDGTRWIAQLSIWNGTSLALENVRTWYWISNTEISSVTAANITGSKALDIVTGGAYFDGTQWIAQLCTWNGTSLALENVKTWFWTSNTYINSVAVGALAGNGIQKIVTGGTYFDGTRNVAQLAVWTASTLAFENVAAWYWTGNTEINSIAVGNITGGTALSIVAAGDFNDATRLNAQVSIWNGTTLALQNVASWYQTSNTKINSVIIGNYSSGTSLDVITAGGYNDGIRNNAQLIAFNGATLATISSTNWFQTSDTVANSVAIGNLGTGNRVITAGTFFDGTRTNAQMIVWG